MVNRYSFRSQSFINTVFLTTTHWVTSAQSHLIPKASNKSTTLVVPKANSDFSWHFKPAKQTKKELTTSISSSTLCNLNVITRFLQI